MTTLTSLFSCFRKPRGYELPDSLTLAFSEASDHKRIMRLFDPVVKDKIDPYHFVVKRNKKVMDHTIDNKGCAFLSDDKGRVHTLTMAYPIYKDKKNKTPQDLSDYTEIGSTLTRMGGYASGQLIVAALALKEWWERPPKNLIATEILGGNGPSIRTYSHYLQWEQIRNETLATDLHKLCNKIIADKDKDRPTIWFHASSATVMATQARILLEFMEQGGLLNKKTGHKIEVDFKALDQIGLTRKRLESVARGVTNRSVLKKMDTPAPT